MISGCLLRIVFLREACGSSVSTHVNERSIASDDDDDDDNDDDDDETFICHQINNNNRLQNEQSFK